MMCGKLYFAFFLFMISVISYSKANDIKLKWSINAQGYFSNKTETLESNGRFRRSTRLRKTYVFNARFRKAMLDAHNKARRQVVPPASNMKKMIWDNALGRIATNYAKKCVFEHNPRRSDTYKGYVGENLYISRGRGDNVFPQLAYSIQLYVNEKRDYSYSKNTCIPGRVCGHYTQVVWEDSYKVGCGAAYCRSALVPGNSPWSDATIIVCNYAPGGNYVGRKPYVTGKPCSRCQSSEQCVNKLCVKRQATKPNTPPKWRKWGAWTRCSTTCGGGKRTRRRTCSGKRLSACSGKSSQTAQCNTARCKSSITATWTKWATWTRCSASCDGGRRARRRTCSPKGSFLLLRTSSACSGKSLENQPCNTGKCTVIKASWRKWGSWSRCSASCGGGRRNRRRTCTSRKPAACKGRAFQSQGCSTGNCGSSASWQKWGSWSRCSQTCGGGRRNRRRTCSSRRPSACTGRSVQSAQCNTGRCTAKASWRQWGQWSRCTATCGGGSRTRTRTCSSKRVSACEGKSSQTWNCNTGRCRSTRPQGWAPWQSWSKCTLSCGGGLRTRSRVCRAATCPGKNSVRWRCNTHRC